MTSPRPSAPPQRGNLVEGSGGSRKAIAPRPQAVAVESELLEWRHAVDEWTNAFGDSEDDLDHPLL